MKKQYIKLFSIIAFIGVLFALMIGIGGVPTVKAETESTLSLTLIGDSTIYLYKGTEYKEFGATAYDTVEGDLTDSIVINNNVYKDTVGTYTVSYSVSNGSSQTAAASRTVIVFDSLYSETMVQNNTHGGYSSYSSYFSKIIETSDGGFLAIGSTCNSNSYYNVIAVKYSSNLEQEWAKTVNYSYYDYARDVIEDEKGNFLVFWYDQYNENDYLTVFDKNDGSILNGYYSSFGAGGDFTSVTALGNNKYVVSYTNGIYRVVYVTVNPEDYSLTYETVNTNTNLYNSCVIGDNVYSFSTAKIIKEDLISHEKKEVNFFDSADTSKYFVSGEYLYYALQRSEKVYVYKLDAELNIIEECNYTNINITELCVTNNIMLVMHYDGVVILNSNDFTYLNKLPFTRSLYSAYDLLLSAQGDVYYVGADYSRCTIKKFYDITLVSQINTYYSDLYQEINYNDGIGITDIYGNIKGTYTCDCSQVDNTKAGNYKAYYTFTIVDEYGIKTYYVGRDIIVEPKTSFEDGATYSGSKVIDVEGGNVTINGQAYSYGDIYNIPGGSTMVITGENGYTKTINFTIELTVDGVEKDTTYYTPVIPTISGGEITLDGQPYVSETPIITKGHHTLIIKGANSFKETINFTIETTIIGIEDGKTYYETLYPDVNGENMTLNGVAWNNEPIENCGNYTLVITGTNGYRKTVTFIIETVVTDLVNGETYEEEVTPTFTKGTATLNGEPYASGTTIYTPGLNTLVITGENGYSVTYKFTINLGVENVAQGETYIGEVTPVISGGIITLNEQPYVSGTKIDVPGYYTITVLGADGYRNDIHFIVKPYEVNVVNGETYNHSVIPVVSNGSLTLNDVPYTSGTVINTSGEYTLVIVGENGYYETITFTLVTGANVEDGAHYNEPVTLKFVGTATLNGVDVFPDTVIENVGNYELVLVDGENTFTYNFVIEPDYSIFDGRITSCVIDFKNCSLMLNGNAIVGRNEINTVGDYALVVEGENGYTKTINFAICAETNVENGCQYNSGLTLNAVGGTITLNDEIFTDSMILTEIGTYVLKINGNNGHEEIITFDIVPEISGVENATVYYNSVTPIIIGGSVTLNGEEYISGTVITEEGVYQLVISGVGGYTQTINFVVLSEEFEVKENGIYMPTISITHNVCDMEINGTAYSVGTAINTVGENMLTFIYNGERTDVTFYVFPLVSGVENGKEYTGEVKPEIEWNNLLLNGKTYVSGTPIVEVGYYVLTVANLNGYNYEIEFTIKEVWENIEENGIYEYSIAPRTKNYKTLYLDGNYFSNGSTVYEVGYHIVKIEGVNGYVNEIPFTVTERISNLENEKEYTGSIYPTVSSAKLYLDGEMYSSGAQIYKVGYHTLLVKGVNGYEKEYKFTILPTVSGAKEEKEYSSGTSISCNYATIKLDGEDWSSGSRVYNVGHHTVEILGTNGYVHTYNFTIIPSYSGIEDGAETTSYVCFYCDYATLKLNGESYSSGAYIYDLGNHEVEILGTNGYSKKVYFTKKESINITDGYESSSSISLSIDHISNFRTTIVSIDDDRIYSNTTIYDIGYHEVEIIGVGGYTKAIRFTRTPNTSISDGAEYSYSKTVSVDYISNFTNTVVKLDGEILTNSKTIYSIGYHTLTIEGVNGYKVEKTFTIKANWSGVTKGTSYTSQNGTYLRLKSDSSNSSVLSEERYEKILLDGQPFTNNTYCYTVGNHKFEIYGMNGYIETIEFVINPVVEDIFDVSSVIVKNDSSYPFNLKDGVYTSTNSASYSNAQLTITASIDIELMLSYSISSEAYYDTFTVIKNGVKIINASGSLDWVDCKIMMQAGEVLKISYQKDGSNSYGDDSVKFKVNLKSEGTGRKINPKIYLNNTNTFQDETTYVLLDGQPYTLNSTIDTVGYHTLKIFGVGDYEKEYKITVIPTIADIADDATYEGSVTPNIDRCDILLDGETYISGTPIVAVGHHTIEMIGVNDYALSYSFTITPSHVEDYSDKVFYKEVAVNTIENATLYLDGEFYNGEKITSLGHHTIKIEGTNGYEQSFDFSISEKPILKDVNGYKDFVDGFTSEYMVNIIIPDAELFIDGVAYTSGTDYYTVGLHYLRIVGENGYEAEYTFTLTERVNGLVNGQEYSSLKLNCENIESMHLNGVAVSNLTEVNLVGNYTLVVSGTNGYTNEYNFTIGLNLKNVENEGVYNSAIAPIANAETIYLNGAPFTSGETVSNVGYHSMRIEGVGGYVHEISFTINVRIDGVKNGEYYQGAVCPSINSDQILLNGNPYESGTVISTIGYYKIKIMGVGGYEKELSFTISDNLQGLTNGATYQENVTPIFNSATTVTLDGATFTSGTPILSSNIGIHKLKFVGVGGYEKEYVFTIIPTVENIEVGGTYQGSVSPVINGGSFKLNGQAISLDNPITTIGYNKLTVHGTNGYVQEIRFTIEPVIENLESSYQQSFTPNVIGSGMTMKLNGSSYTNGTKIETVGNNKLVVSGYGGYTKTFTITVAPLITGIENEAIVYGSVQIKVSPSATLKIDGASYTNNASYTKVGHHTLKITGANGYVQTLAFTLKEDSSTISAEQYSGAFKLTFNKNNFEIRIDGANYSSNTNYYTIGHHELTLVGSNGYTSTYKITVTPVLNGVEDKGEYNEKVSIATANGKIYIDGVLYSAGTEYKKVGNHTLTMTGTDGYEFSLTFTVTPKVSGIAEGGSYSNSASWTIPSDCTAKLDGVSVNVNSSTAKIGNHTIEIIGANGYQTTISFTVTETVNITDGAEYNKVITIDIPDCTAFLNDSEITDLYELNTPGSYTLTVFGTNGYTSEYKFTVISVLSGVINGQNYDGSVTANTSIGQWYLDDQPYVSGTLITEIGHHTLKVSGPEYEQICSFTITVDVSAYANNLKTYNYTDTDLELYINGEKYTARAKFNQVGNHTVEYRGANGYVSSAEFTVEYTYNGNSDYKYKDSAVIDIPNATLYVNGTQIENLTEINSIGNNIITIKGMNGYEKTVEIFIAPTLTIENGEVRSEKFEIKKLNAIMYLDGVAISEDTIVDTHGTHTLKIEGANGYVQEITFTFDNPNNDYVIMISVLVGLAATAFVVMIILRKKVL